MTALTMDQLIAQEEQKLAREGEAPETLRQLLSSCKGKAARRPFATG